MKTKGLLSDFPSINKHYLLTKMITGEYYLKYFISFHKLEIKAFQN